MKRNPGYVCFWAMLALLILGSASVSSAGSQGAKVTDFVWFDQFGSSSNDGGFDVVADATGVYLAGSTEGTLEGQTTAGGRDAFLRKYSEAGGEAWTRQFGTVASDQPEGIASDGSGIYIVGETSGALPNQTNAGAGDVYVRKYGSEGNQLWTRQFGTPSDDIPYDIDAGASGVYVSGLTVGVLPNQSGLGGGDAFVRKYNADGNELWTRQFGSPWDEWGFGVAAGPGGVYAAGGFRGYNETGVWAQEAFLQKFDLDGNVLWLRRFGGQEPAGEDRASDVCADASGVYVVGEMDNKAFVRKYDADGNLLWVDNFGTGLSYARSVAVDPPWVFVAGSTTGEVGRPNPDHDKDPWIRKYDLEGNVVWTFQFGNSQVEDATNGIDAGPYGVYVAGATSGDLLDRYWKFDFNAFLVRVGETPEPPSEVSASPGDRRVVLAWGSPAFDGHAAVTAFRVYRAEGLGAFTRIATVGGATRAFVDEMVENNVTYRYRLAAENAVGEGPWSVSVGATPLPPPLLVLTTPDEFVSYGPLVTIEGRTESNVTVAINGAEVSVGADGTFRWRSTLRDGLHEIRVIARNPIGLTSTATVRVTVNTGLTVFVLVMLAVGGGGTYLIFAHRHSFRSILARLLIGKRGPWRHSEILMCWPSGSSPLGVNLLPRRRLPGEAFTLPRGNDPHVPIQPPQSKVPGRLGPGMGKRPGIRLSG